MSTIKNLELRDSIRRDALRFMDEEGLSYEDAFDKATKRLIGDQQILDFEFKPLTTENKLHNKDNKISEEIKTNTSSVDEKKEEDPYIEDIKNRLKNLIDVDDYTNEQLEEYIIAKEMGVDIKKFADKNYQPNQIKFLSLQLLMGESIEKYKGNYGFNPDIEFEKQLTGE